MASQKLTDAEIGSVLSLIFPMSEASCLGLFLEERALQPWFKLLKSSRVIEIGPGLNPIASYFPCGEYVAAEAHTGIDGLTVLRRQPERSAVVVSFNVIDDFVLGAGYELYGEALNSRYACELAEEIKRVMNPFAIILGADATKYLGRPDIPALNFGGVYLPQ
ncbi:hypothetical protein HYU18_03150 [Candidatus Woesearchaeota archaeon]|nr:hypothetical protein [Candidatus Woesearchaeota archaeon]